MLIRDLDPENDPEIEQAAEALVEGFRDHWPAAWPDLADAREEAREALEAGRVCRAAWDEAGGLLGWIGGRPTYARVWELHPLVVRPHAQGRGIGRALVADLEREIGARGGLTLMLGTDDEDDMTTLGGVDLYPDVLPHLARIRNLRGHPYEFYQKCGFVIVGAVPDANGFGKPDILMAKRVTGVVEMP
ncbi:MAG: GNAT family N-acetyltransferase [Anaerolineae bacterium]